MATEGKNLSAYDKEKLPDASKLRIGLVVSEWNEEITEALYRGANETLMDCGVLPDNILRWNVPGSFELTYGCKKLLQTQKVDAIIASSSFYLCVGMPPRGFRERPPVVERLLGN